jgi:hypothetical protein
MAFKIAALFTRKSEADLVLTPTNTLSQRQIQRMYKVDWMIEYKYGMLMLLVGLIADGTEEPGDIQLAIHITREIEYLIEVSQYIPEKHKESVNQDNKRLREFFEGLTVIN